MSESNKFTPGPWVIVNGCDIYSLKGADSGDGVPADSTDGWHIASIGDFPTFVDGVETELGSDVKKANARLLISAPDLLYALDKMLDHFEGNVPLWLFEISERAINKARGQQ